MVKLLAVCGNGMGTSMLMKLKAKGILDKYKIQNVKYNIHYFIFFALRQQR